MLPARSLRQAQADDTRARLFAAAAGLFATQGYHETTVDQIAREAGVAKGTFFVHFTTKDAVITELVGKQVRAARRAREHEQGTPVDRLRAAVLALGDQAGVSRGLSRAVLSATLANAEVGSRAGDLFHEVLAGMIEDARAAQAAGLLTTSTDAETIANTLMASYLGAALHFASATDPVPILSVLSPIVEANLAGFAAKNGEARGVAPKKPKRRRNRKD